MTSEDPLLWYHGVHRGSTTSDVDVATFQW